MSKGIRLSEKHGVNPTLLHCPICCEETGVGLVGRLPNDEEAPRRSLDVSPCKKCQSVIDAGGVMLIETDPATEKATGFVWGVTREGFERVAGQPPTKPVMKITPEMARAVGLHSTERSDA